MGEDKPSTDVKSDVRQSHANGGGLPANTQPAKTDSEGPEGTDGSVLALPLYYVSGSGASSYSIT